MTNDFSFARMAGQFDYHINSSIPGYADLMGLCVRLGGRFIQEDTSVVDVGCTSGTLLSLINEQYGMRRKEVAYIGLDVVPEFRDHWSKHSNDNLRFEVRDARRFAPDRPISLATSIFTVQFLKPEDKVPLLKRLCDSMVEGGALLMAEKTLASNARFQDALTFPYYDVKLKNGFSSEEILDKERSLRGQMTLWEQAEFEENLRKAGFGQIQWVWGHFPFLCYLALKS